MEKDELERQFLKLQGDFRGLCALFAVQQAALEKLKVAVDMHQKELEGRAGPPPDPGGASVN